MLLTNRDRIDRNRMFVKLYEFLSFAKDMGKSLGKNKSKKNKL